MVWIGLKVKLNGNRDSGEFWLGWGRRRLVGWGLRMEEQTEDVNGITTFLPIRTQIPMIGGLRIPSDVIFSPLHPPADSPELVVAFEDVRQAISDGWAFM
jgi:hypothetical protein